MGIWETLINLAATAIKEHPRQEVLVRLIELRNSMHACQKIYDDYQAIMNAGDYDQEIERRSKLPLPSGVEFASVYDPRGCWPRVVDSALATTGDVLAIFSPDADQSVRVYSFIEAMAVDKALDCSPSKTMNALQTEIDIPHMSLPAQFTLAVGKLDEFLRQNFKPEEVYVWSKQVIGAWPHPLRFFGEYWLTID